MAASMVSMTVNAAGPYVTVARAALDTRDGRGGAAQNEDALRFSGKCVSVCVWPVRGTLSVDRAGAFLARSSAPGLGYQASDFLGLGTGPLGGGTGVGEGVGTGLPPT